MFCIHVASALLFISCNLPLQDAYSIHDIVRPPPFPFPTPFPPQEDFPVRPINEVDFPIKYPPQEDFPVRPPNNVEENPEDAYKDGKDHPCSRKCDGKPMACKYHFDVEWYESMSKACYNCPFNETDCRRKDCVIADGRSRSITVVNRKMPGPAIEVCQNDSIIVDVANDLMASGTTIHWHGMYQKDHPFMDGTPFVTQCPIQPGSTFRYEFPALQAGTYFWHSHIGLQRGDGVNGALIIRQVKAQDHHGPLYDYDESDHTMLITDWSDRLSVGMFTGHYHSSMGTTPTTLLINGIGRFQITNGNKTTVTKPKRFDVKKGKRYRFRLINAEFLNCPVELSVDGHNITVIATDGSDLEPVTAASLVSYSGERFDFIISANNKVGNYWVRIRGLLGCAGGSNPVRQVGVLHYEGAKGLEPSELTWNSPPIGLRINGVNEAEEQTVSRPVSKLRSIRGPDDSLKPVPDYKFYIAYDLYAKNNTHYNKYPFYGYNQVRPTNEDYAVPTPQLNHISMKLPTSPLLYTQPSEDHFCNQFTVNKTCELDYCQCPHVIKVKLDSVVEIIIIDEGAPFDSNHPFHLHGYSFRVVGQRRLNSSTTVEAVQNFERTGQMTRNLKNPPLKDTVTVPDGGYTVVRFKANNPGYWLFHCHIEFHAEVGMALVFKVGEHHQMVTVPNNFPKCGDFKNGGFQSIQQVVVRDYQEYGQVKV